MKDDSGNDADHVWKALADPTRRELMDLLSERPRTTGELCAAFPALGRTTVMKHAGIGLLVGAASGALAGPYVLSSACITPEKDLDAQWQCFDDLVDGEARLKATVLFGIAGTAIGAVVGAIVGRERWEKVAQDRVRVSFAPQRDGSFALRTSVRF